MTICNSIFCSRKDTHHEFDVNLCQSIVPGDQLHCVDDDRKTPFKFSHAPDARLYGADLGQEGSPAKDYEDISGSPDKKNVQVGGKNPQDFIKAFYLRWMTIDKREEIMTNPMAPLIELVEAPELKLYATETSTAQFILRSFSKEIQQTFVCKLISNSDIAAIKHLDMLAKGADWVISGMSTRLLEKASQELDYNVTELCHKLDHITDIVKQGETISEILRSECNNVSQVVKKLEAETNKRDIQDVQRDIPRNYGYPQNPKLEQVEMKWIRNGKYSLYLFKSGKLNAEETINKGNLGMTDSSLVLILAFLGPTALRHVCSVPWGSLLDLVPFEVGLSGQPKAEKFYEEFVKAYPETMPAQIESIYIGKQ